MKKVRVFYSWQSDLPEKTNKFFIKGCLEKAIKEINREFRIDDAERDETAAEAKPAGSQQASLGAKTQVELDHDTKDVPGIPDIFQTILLKIDESDIFIADASFVGINKAGSRFLPNPNVMIELGYALSKLGPEAIILIMDSSAGGLKAEERPFDLRHKRPPIFFDSQTADIKSEEKCLIAAFKEAIMMLIRGGSMNKNELASVLSLRMCAGQDPILPFEEPESHRPLAEAQQRLQAMRERESKPPKPGTFGYEYPMSGFTYPSVEQYEEYVTNLSNYLTVVSTSIEIVLEACSESEELISDCDAIVRFSEGTQLLYSMPSNPHEPGKDHGLVRFLGSIKRPAGPSDPPEPTIHGNTVSYKIPSIKRGLPIALDSFFLRVLDGQESITFSYTLVCGKPHDSVEGTLTFKIARPQAT